LTSLFYHDPAHYAFAFQLYMLRSRQCAIHEFQQDTIHGRKPQEDMLFWDRSWLGDYVFMRTNVENGNISIGEALAYEKLLGWNLDSHELLKTSDADRYVLITARPEVSKYRLEHVRKNESEKSIPLEYYQQLDNMHFNIFVRHLMADMEVPVRILPTERCDDMVAAWTTILDEPASECQCARLASPDEVPNVEDFMEYFPTIDRGVVKTPMAIRYDDEKAVREAYHKLCAGKVDEALGTKSMLGWPKQIYVRENMMCRDMVKNYSITRLRSYETPFIQLVYAHLGRGYFVHFY
jgi:deoxyadenosine/deoxycytidine kinase